jgi:hypothetical protein
MNRTKVESSNIKSVGWKENNLEVEFNTGSLYRYSDVTEDVFNAFLKAESKGKYFHEYIKGNYQSEKIEEKMPSGRRIKNIVIRDSNYEEIIYKQTLVTTLKDWIKIYSEEDGNESKKESRQTVIAFLKYFIGEY